ncbi:protein kinase [Planctomycetota bacterium]
MTCLRRPGVEALLDEALSADARTQLEQHARSCTCCSEAMAAGAALRRTLQAGMYELVPTKSLDELTDRVLIRLALLWSKAEGGQSDARPSSDKPSGRNRSATQKSPTAAIPGYVVVEKIGKGGMGAVFRARQTSMDRFVALKLLSPLLARNADYVRRFVREARAAASLSHPNVVRTYDVGSYKGLYYHVMELVEGHSLREKLRTGPVSPDEAISITRAIAQALEHAEHHGIVHRDVKPDNILLEEESGTPKLADLGLARVAPEKDTTGTVTVAGTVMGTPNFMSPEQASDAHSADHRSDIYSLGATLYYMLTGKRPFDAPSPVEVLTRVLNERLTLPDELDLPVGLRHIFDRMVDPDPNARYQTASEVAEDLESGRCSRPVAPSRPSSSRRRPRTPAAHGADMRRLHGVPPISVRTRRARPRKSGTPAVTLLIVSLIAIAAMVFLALRPFSKGERDRTRGSRSNGSVPANHESHESGRERPAVLPASESQATARLEGKHEEALSASGAHEEEAQAAEKRGGAGAEEQLSDTRQAETRSEGAAAKSNTGHPHPGDIEPAAQAGRDSRFVADMDEARELLAAGELQRAAAAAQRVLGYGSQPQKKQADELLAEIERLVHEDRERAELAVAAETYRPIRHRICHLLALFELDEARALLAQSRESASLAPVREEMVRDAEDADRLHRLLQTLPAALEQHVGSPIRLELRNGDTVTGALRRNEETYLVSGSGGLRVLSLKELHPVCLLELAETESPVEPGARAVLLCVTGHRDAEKAVAAWRAAGATEKQALSLLQKLGLVRAAREAEEKERRDRLATDLLTKADAAYDKAKTARDPRRCWREARRDYRNALRRYPQTDDVVKRRAEVTARLAEIEEELAAKQPSGRLGALFRGRLRELPDDVVEIAYDFTAAEASSLLPDWRPVDSVRNPMLLGGLNRLPNGNPKPPAPLSDTPPWFVTEQGLLGWGWDRLVWKGKLKGDVQVMVTATPLTERTLLVTVCDDGLGRFYGLATGFSLPRFPSFLRNQFPDLFDRFAAWAEPSDAVFECVSFPDLREMARRPPTLVAGRRTPFWATRNDGPAGAAILRLGVTRTLEGEDSAAPFSSGSVGLGAWGSSVIFHSVRIRGALDPEWLEQALRRHESDGTTEQEQD